MLTKTLVFILVAFLLNVCTNEENEQPSGSEATTEMKLETIIKDNMGMLHSDLLNEHMQLVIKSEQELSDIWIDDNDMPLVNFETEMLAVVSLGQQPSSGYDVEITSMEVSGEDLLIYFTETRPGELCMTLTVITNPIHIVKVQKSSLNPVFIVNPEVIEC